MQDGREKRYSRQMILSAIGEDGQRAIAKSTAVVIGLGALGCTSANILARAGVGTLRLVDRDVVDWTNLQRQGLYTEDDAESSLPKAVAAKRHLERVNSEIDLEALIEDVNPANIERIIAGATVVIDGLDGYRTRALLNEACFKHSIPWVHGACLATYGEVATFLPGKTGCYSCLFPRPTATVRAPQTCDTVGILGPAAFAVASWQAAEALKILTGREGEISRSLAFFDLWSNHWANVTLAPDPDCTVCGGRQFPLLQQGGRVLSTVICGSNAVQVLPASLARFDFERTSSILSKSCPVEISDYFLRLQLDRFQMILFRDGRAIIFGTSDPGVARNLYGRYIGD